MGRKAKIYQYQDFGEVLKPSETAKLLGVSLPKLWEWIHTGATPMGALVKGEHYYKIGVEYRIIKDRICELFGILPKHIIQISEASK